MLSLHHMMKTFIARFTLVVLGVTVAVASSVSAEPLSKWMPTDAVIYFEWTGADALQDDFAKSHLAGLLKDVDLDEKLIALVSAAMEDGLARDPAMQQRVEQAMDLAWRKHWAVAFRGITFPEQGRRGEGVPVPHLLFMVRAGEDADQIEAALQDLRHAAGDAPFDIKIERAADTLRLSLGDPGEAGLARNPAFVSAIPARPGASALMGYVNVTAGIELIKQGMAFDGERTDEMQQVLDVIGFNRIESIGFRSGFDGPRFLHTARITAPGLIDTPMGTLIQGRLTAQDLALAPASASWARWSRLDLAAVAQAARNVAGTMAPDQDNPVDAFFAEGKQELGFDIETELLEPTGDVWLTYTDADAAVPVPLAMIAPADDAVRLGKTLDQLMAKAIDEEGQDQIQRRQIQGSNAYSFNTPLPGGITPTLGVINGRFILGATPQLAAAAAQAPAGRPLVDTDLFRQAVAPLGIDPQQALAFMVADLRESARTMLSLYNMGLGLMAREMNDDLPIDLETLLPTLAQLKPHLGHAASIVRVEGDVIDWVTSEPFPGSILLSPEIVASQDPVTLALMSSVMLPAMGTARNTARETKAMSNARQLCMGIAIYTVENRERMPQDMTQVLAAADLTALSMVHPLQPKPADFAQWDPDQQNQWALANLGFFYVRAANSTTDIDNPTQTVVIFSDPALAKRGNVAVGFADGHVETKTVDWLMENVPAARDRVEMR